MGGRNRLRWVLAAWIALAGVAGGSGVQAGTTRYVARSGGDDTAAINAAIAASAAGDIVSLKAGIFSTTGAIQAKTGVAIVGASKTTTIVRCTGGGGHPMVELAGASNVEIANLTLDGNNSGSVAQGINASGVSGEYIHDVRIQKLPSNQIGIYFSSAVTSSRIVACEIADIGVGSEWGAGIRLAWGSSQNRVLNNTIARTGRGGILANDGSTDLVIQGNRVSGSGGVGLGIEVWNGCHRALIQKNAIDHWLSVNRSNGVAVRGNTISDKSGVFKFGGIEMADACTDNVFSDNVVDGGAQIGITVSGNGYKARTYWAHNIIKACSTWGSQIQSDDGSVDKFYFFANTFRDMPADSPAELYDNQGNGFRLNPNTPNIVNVTSLTLDGNTITANARIGIELGDWNFAPFPSRVDKMTAIGNTITNNGGPAFVPDFGTVGPFFGNDLRWEGNTVTGNGSNYQPPSKGTFFAPANRPSVTIIAPTLPIVGKPVAFSFRYTGRDPQAEVLWDLGDGLPSTAARPSFTYVDPGDSRVGLVVWDSAGRAAHDELLLTVALSRPFLRGDANGDGSIDLSDAVKILFHLFKAGAIPCEKAADVNDDGTLNISDAVFLLGFLFLGEQAPNEPLGSCGADPTRDGLACESFPACP